MFIRKPRSWSLNQTDVSVGGNSNRVISYKLFAQEQKVRLGTMYPFLPQEQIQLKIKERWNKMEISSKQNYTRSVLNSKTNKLPLAFKRPLTNITNNGEKKFLSGETSNSCDGEGDVDTTVMKPKMRNLYSENKVVDWLTDQKLIDPTKRKTYNASSYNVQYNVPSVVDSIPSKQPGILKVNSEKKRKSKSNEKKSTKKPPTRVSFSSDKEGDKDKSNVSRKLSMTDNDVADEQNFPDNAEGNESSSSVENISPSQNYCGNKSASLSMVESIVFEEELVDELFTTPDRMTPLKKLAKAPRKRKSTDIGNWGSKSKIKSRQADSISKSKTKDIPNMSIDNASKLKRSSLKGTVQQVKNSKKNSESESENDKTLSLNCNNNHNNNNNNARTSDVFGKKPWAATSYSKRLRSKNNRVKSFHVNVVSQLSTVDDAYSIDNIGDDSEDERSNFILRGRGLIVGPVRDDNNMNGNDCSDNDNFDDFGDDDLNDDTYNFNEVLSGSLDDFQVNEKVKPNTKKQPLTKITNQKSKVDKKSKVTAKKPSVKPSENCREFSSLSDNFGRKVVKERRPSKKNPVADVANKFKKLNDETYVCDFDEVLAGLEDEFVCGYSNTGGELRTIDEERDVIEESEEILDEQKIDSRQNGETCEQPQIRGRRQNAKIGKQVNSLSENLQLGSRSHEICADSQVVSNSIDDDVSSMLSDEDMHSQQHTSTKTRRKVEETGTRSKKLQKSRKKPSQQRKLVVSSTDDDYSQPIGKESIEDSGEINSPEQIGAKKHEHNRKLNAAMQIGSKKQSENSLIQMKNRSRRKSKQQSSEEVTSESVEQEDIRHDQYQIAEKRQNLVTSGSRTVNKQAGSRSNNPKRGPQIGSNRQSKEIHKQIQINSNRTCDEICKQLQNCLKKQNDDSCSQNQCEDRRNDLQIHSKKRQIYSKRQSEKDQEEPRRHVKKNLQRKSLEFHKESKRQADKSHKQDKRQGDKQSKRHEHYPTRRQNDSACKNYQESANDNLSASESDKDTTMVKFNMYVTSEHIKDDPESSPSDIIITDSICDDDDDVTQSGEPSTDSFTDSEDSQYSINRKSRSKRKENAAHSKRALKNTLKKKVPGTRKSMKDENDKRRNYPKCKPSCLSPEKSKFSFLSKPFVIRQYLSPVIIVSDDSYESSDDDNVMKKNVCAVSSSDTLMKILSRMREITSPIQVKLEEPSPKLLSPTLSGISELTSMSQTSVICSNWISQQPTSDIKVELSPIKEDLSENPSVSKSVQKPSGENFLCSMFQEISPKRDNRRSHGRRLLSSNQRKGISKFNDLFSCDDIF